MLNNFNHTLSKWGAQKVKFFAPWPSFLADLIVVYYINTVYLEKLRSPEYINQSIQNFKRLGILHRMADMGSVRQLYQVTLTSIGAMFFIILCCNFILYLLCMTKFKWPRTYIKGYAFSAVLFSVVELTLYIFNGDGFNFYTFFSTLLYLLTYLIYKHFRQTEEL